MKYLIIFFIALVASLLISCDSKEPSPTLANSPLVDLLAPTLATAIESGEAAIQTALEKQDYSNTTIDSLTALKQQLSQLKSANQLVMERRADTESVTQLLNGAQELHKLRGLLESDIIALKSTNTAAAIRLGVVNELTEFCQLSAEDIGNALTPSTIQ